MAEPHRAPRWQVRAIAAAAVAVAASIVAFQLGDELEGGWGLALSALGALLAVGGGLLGCVAAALPLFTTERGSVSTAREASLAFEAALLPGGLVGVLLLESPRLPDLNRLAPDWVLVPQAAFLAGVMAGAWLLAFAWRMRPLPDRADPRPVGTPPGLAEPSDRTDEPSRPRPAQDERVKVQEGAGPRAG
jgi:hypothetical protein